MKTIRTSLLLLAVFALSGGCESEIDLELDEYEAKIVVEGYMISGQTARVHLMRNIGFFSSLDLTNYDVANGDSIDIIDVTWATFDASIWESATIIGKDAEFAYTADGNGTVLSVVNIVPEPSTYALIAGMIGLVVVMLRRR